MERESTKSKTCFVCEKVLEIGNFSMNTKVNLLVCNECKDSEAENKAVREALDSLGEGFVCGCI